MASKLRDLFAKLTVTRKLAFVKRVCLFCVEGELVMEMKRFMDENEFEEEVSGGEHKLEWTTIHKTFCDKFEDQIESFIRKQGYRPEAFYEYLKIMAEDDPSSVSMQLDVFLSAFDYRTFVDLMTSTEKRKYWIKVLGGWAAYFKMK